SINNFSGQMGVYIGGDITGGGLPPALVVRTVDGDLTLDGTGGGVTVGYGTLINGGAVVEATGLGNVIVTGNGSTIGTSFQHGVLITQPGTLVRASAGDITITGIGGGNLDNNLGIGMTGGAIVQVTGPTSAIT